MFSIRKFLGNDEKFFDLLEGSAQQAETSVHQLVDLLRSVETTIHRRASRRSSTAGGRINKSRRS